MAQSTASFDQKLTPMMEQYRSIKKTLPPETILFFRLGDFYEMFFEDAHRAAAILNITLTGRDAGAAGRVPMCGIPYHAFQSYVRMLLNENLKVAICEQMEEAAGAKGLVERKVTRIITPATYLEDEAASARPEYLAALCTTQGEWALAALDLATGEFFVRILTREQLSHDLVLLGPREVVFPKALTQDPELSRLVREVLRASVTVYEDWIFEPEEGRRFLQERFSLASERAVPFHDRPSAVAAAGAVLYYLKDHLHSGVNHIRMPVLLGSHEFMTLDRQTLKNLELVTSMGGDSRFGNLLSVVDQTLTPMGGRTLSHWITHPLVSLAQIECRQQGVAELAGNPSMRVGCAKDLKGVRDIERTLSRLSYGVANAPDLLNLKSFLERVPRIQTVLRTALSGLLKDLLKVMQPFPELTELIGRSIVESPPLTVKEGGMIREGFSEALDELRQLERQGRSWLIDFEKRQIETTGIKSLKVKYSQVFGYAIEVSKPNLPAVPSHYVRRQTLANAERFIVPELKEWDERLSSAQARMKALEYEIFQQVRAEVLKCLSPLQVMAKAMGTLDALGSLASVAVQKGWIRPVLTESCEIEIQGGRHPVVEAALPTGQFVENDTLLNDQDQQLIVLTGPNMAGKSTYIRQVAQIVLLSQIGSFVPADRARIGVVDRIFTRMGASDDLSRGESTFMVEMVEMAQILQLCTPASLLILDEVGRGTSTFDGVSLAWAICEQLVSGNRRPRTLFATHYHELIQLEAEFQAIKNYTMQVKETAEGIVFLRKVTRGGSDRSYGIHVAKLAGIPSGVTERAAQILEERFHG